MKHDERPYGRRTWYDGTLFDSQLEARFAAFFDLIGVKFERQWEGLKLHYYIPDFYHVEDDFILEVKGKVEWVDDAVQKIRGSGWHGDYIVAVTPDVMFGSRPLFLPEDWEVHWNKALEIVKWRGHDTRTVTPLSATLAKPISFSAYPQPAAKQHGGGSVIVPVVMPPLPLPSRKFRN